MSFGSTTKVPETLVYNLKSFVDKVYKNYLFVKTEMFPQKAYYYHFKNHKYKLFPRNSVLKFVPDKLILPYKTIKYYSLFFPFLKELERLFGYKLYFYKI